MNAIEIDDARYPLVVVRFVGTVDDKAFGDYIDAMTRIRGRGANVAIFDATHAGAVSPRQRRMQSDWLRDFAPELEKNSLGTAFVITNRVIRGILTAILWVTKIPGPYVVLPSFSQAMIWAEEQLDAAGLSIPE